MYTPAAYIIYISQLFHNVILRRVSSNDYLDRAQIFIGLDMEDCFIRNRNCLSFMSTSLHLLFLGGGGGVVLVGCVLLLFLALYDILLLSLSFFCVLCRMLPESLDCPFLIASSVFSNDHLYKVVKSCKTQASRIQTTHMGKTQQLRNYLF